MVTLLQMGQFLAMNGQAIFILAFRCPFPRNITWVYLFYIMSLFALFLNFYLKTYTRPAASKKKAQ
jgi:elongation of very long chain fatty acids protein 4